MLSTSRENGIIKVSISCDITGDKTNELKDLILAEINAEISDVQMDMKECDMIDSTGIGVLILTQNNLKPASKKLEIINLSEDMIKMFRIMRLDKHFTISGR